MSYLQMYSTGVCYVFQVGYGLRGGCSCVAFLVRDLICSTGVPTKHATYQIVLPIIYLYCFKGKFRVKVGVNG